MCWMCDQDAKATLTRYAQDAWAGQTGFTRGLAGLHFSEAAAGGKYFDAFPVDGVGDLKPPVTIGLIITPDEAGGGKNVPPGNPVLVVNAAHTIATINTIGDEDFFQVTLTAGTTYEIGQYAYFAGPNGTHLTDPYVELYRTDGTTLVVSADGGANTPYNDANSGFDVLLTYTPDVTGTYYVNARAFSNSPATDNGDSVGDYELFVRVQDPNDPDIYHPYYEPDEPLYAIDWGTQVNKVNQSVRNPDGDEGTRDTGNGTAELPNNGGTGIVTGDTLGHPGKNIITIYFAQAGDVFASNDPTNPGLPPATITAVAIQDFEYTAVWTALDQFEKVADIVYIEVQDQDDADFIYTSYQGTPGPGVSLLGSMSPPDESDEGLAQFNSGDERWNERDLAQGGFSFVTLIHEFGHGHGLAHPHDNGGHSGIMNGVEEESPFNYTTGDYELNQSVFTMMSYEDGWQSSPYGNAETDVGYGYLGGLSPFDIAAIQDKYGVNEDYNTGNNTYTLKDVNAAGTFYTGIWDGGGIDQIVYNGARNANIDLRAATLQYEWGGGGWVSYAFGIYGGFTIANGVTIENATGGSGNDVLIGNAAANVLYGRGGVDDMSGLAGNDTYYVNVAGDIVRESVGGGSDWVNAEASYALLAGQEVEVLSTRFNYGTTSINLTGNGFGQIIIGNAGDNALYGGGGADDMRGLTGNDNYYVDHAGDIVREGVGQGFDRVNADASHSLAAGMEIEILSTHFNHGTTAMNLTGNEFSQIVIGNAGANVLDGGGGGDDLRGLAGNDTYYVAHAGDVVQEGVGQGFDRVNADASHSLAAGMEVEILSTHFNHGTAAMNLTGNELSQIVIGNAGANVLNGGGGADDLRGLGGADKFAFTTALGGGNVDVIRDYGLDDVIQLDNAVFTGLALGPLSANAFVVGTAAADADDRIIYNNATGALMFDADGNGNGAAVQFATLQGAPAISASEFVVI